MFIIEKKNLNEELCQLNFGFDEQALCAHSRSGLCVRLSKGFVERLPRCVDVER